MYDDVKVKSVGNSTIWLCEADDYKFDIKRCILSTIICILVSIFVGYQFEIVHSDQVILMILLTFICSLLIVMLIGVNYKSIPSYRISTDMDIKSIYISKTSDIAEIDQKEICKAVTILENEIREQLKKISNLQNIANRCK